MSVTIQITKPVDLRKLIAEFAEAGFMQTSSRPGEFITVEDGNDEAAVMAIYNAHDPTPEPEPTIIEFDKIIQAVDFVVASRDIKASPKAALEEAVTEARKAKGIPKSLDLISRSLAVYVEDIDKRMDILEKQVAALIKK